ncbi:hypothetical protein ACOBV9_08745 [Pseudoalteromonas espejiana]
MYRSIIALILMVSVSSAFACSCIERSPEEYFKSANTILFGRIMKLEIVFDNDNRPYQKITLNNEKMIKGNQTKVIYSAMDRNGCNGMSFMLGKEYVAFTDSAGWITGYCGGTQAIWPNMKHSKEVLKDYSTIKP